MQGGGLRSRGGWVNKKPPAEAGACTTKPYGLGIKTRSVFISPSPVGRGLGRGFYAERIHYSLHTLPYWLLNRKKATNNEVDDLLIVGVPGFEPGASCSQNRYANRTALYPD